MPEQRSATSEMMRSQLPNPGHRGNSPDAHDLFLVRGSLPVGSASFMKEEVTFILTLKDRLADLEEQEQQGIHHLKQVCQSGQLSCEIITKALMFFNQMAEEVDLTQRLLEDEVCILVKDSGYNGTRGWMSHGLAGLSPEELMELKEELDLMIISVVQASRKCSCQI